MKVVISGGAGFIGSHFAEFFVNNNDEVHVIDNFRSGYIKNIENLDLTFHNASITEKEIVESIVKGADVIINLAALVSVPESLLKPYETVEINVGGLLNILEAARKFGVKKVIHASSAAIYGDNPEQPKRVSMKPEPKTPYAITKLDGEYYLRMYAEEYGLNTNSLRFFNVFGPRQDPKSQYAAAIPIFIHNAVNNVNITIYGDGEQTRDFVFVKDVVQAGVKAIGFEGKGEVFNVATGKSVSINEIAQTIIRLMGSDSKIIYADERPGDIKFSSASIDETINFLNFSPEFSLSDGLKETVNYFSGDQDE
jgi:UDP-glucose 4-epimerase